MPAATAAYRRDGALVSRRAFYAAACDPRLNCVVEACAGAGKTWMLVSRILRALLEGAEPHEILAITFTRKAAGEMRERLAEWLAHYASPATPDDELAQALVDRGLDDDAARRAVPSLRGLHARVLAAGRPVEIRTFHAWFAQLLGAAPMELLDALNLRPDLTLVEDESEHAGDVFRRFHAAVARDPALEADYRWLVERRGRHDARRWLETAWSKRIELSLADEAGVLEGSVEPPSPARDDGSLPHPAAALHAPRWRTTLNELAKELDRGTPTARKVAASLLAALDAGTDPHDTFQAIRAEIFTDKGKGAPRKHLGSSPLLHDVCDELARMAHDIAQHDAALEHLAMVRLARTLFAEYAAYKRHRGLADMADLERCALALLGDATLAGWVQERLDLRVRHLLIDEFQDTSPLQWQALHGWLSGYAGAGGGASGQQGLTVFIVGDPKQSIYRFRRAEPKVFEAAREFVRHGLDGSILACDHTRRNAPGVLAALNPLFEAAQAAGEYEGFRAHTTEVEEGTAQALYALPGVPHPPSAKDAADEPEPVWRDTLTTPRHQPEEVLREQEAERVAAAIAAEVRDGRLCPGEVFVLSRKRDSLRLAERALQARGVPCAAVEEARLMDAPEVRDLVAVMDALVSTRHRLPLAQALKSPLFGADDADLAALAAEAGPFHDWWGALMRVGRADDSPPALARAARLLAAWRDAGSHLSPHDLLDRIVSEGEATRRYAAAVPVARRVAALAAIDALLAQALLLDGGRYATPYGFVRALKRRAVKAALPTAPDAVQLLTVHGAKGLEARVVFLMDTDPERVPDERLSLLVDWPVGHEKPLICAFVGAEAQCPPSLQALLEREHAARRRETLNMLYVALTRARERVVVSHTAPFRLGDGVSWRVRLEPHAAPWPSDAAATVTLVESAPAPFTLRELPPWRSAGAARAAAQRDLFDASGKATPEARGDDLDPAAIRLGHAVRRVLDWVMQHAGALPALAAAAADEFGVDAAQALQRAAAVLDGPGARFFGGPALRWGGNAVMLADAGEPLVADRLVCLDEAPAGRAWWVLAYHRLHDAAPPRPADDDCRLHLLRCRAAVTRLQPGEPVHCVLVTGGGVVTVEEQALALAG